jgi:hypothetical protein
MKTFVKIFKMLRTLSQPELALVEQVLLVLELA